MATATSNRRWPRALAVAADMVATVVAMVMLTGLIRAVAAYLVR